MIADKLIPTFYVIELEGKAANLEGLLGTKHKIKKVSIHSSDFSNDVEAAIAGQEALDFIKHLNPDIQGEQKTEFNPEFFPSQPEIEVTLQMEQAEIEVEKAMQEQIAENVVGVALTYRFDDWGDFVSQRSQIKDDNFSVIMRIAAHPQRYMLEKNFEKQEQIARLHGHKHSESSICLH